MLRSEEGLFLYIGVVCSSITDSQVLTFIISEVSCSMVTPPLSLLQRRSIRSTRRRTLGSAVLWVGRSCVRSEPSLPARRPSTADAASTRLSNAETGPGDFPRARSSLPRENGELPDPRCLHLLVFFTSLLPPGGGRSAVLLPVLCTFFCLVGVNPAALRLHQRS